MVCAKAEVDTKTFPAEVVIAKFVAIGSSCLHALANVEVGMPSLLNALPVNNLEATWIHQLASRDHRPYRPDPWISRAHRPARLRLHRAKQRVATSSVGRKFPCWILLELVEATFAVPGLPMHSHPLTALCLAGVERWIDVDQPYGRFLKRRQQYQIVTEDDLIHVTILSSTLPCQSQWSWNEPVFLSTRASSAHCGRMESTHANVLACRSSPPNDRGSCPLIARCGPARIH